MKEHAYFQLIIGFFSLIVFSCNPATNDKTSSKELDNNEIELNSEPGIDVLLSQFSTLSLPVVIGGNDFDDPKTFPKSPLLSKESSQADKLYGELVDKGNQLVPIGRIFPNDEQINLLILELGEDYKNIYFICYSADGKQISKTTIANCMLDGEFETAKFLSSRCILKSQYFLSLAEDSDDEIQDYESLKFFRLTPDGHIEESKDCK